MKTNKQRRYELEMRGLIISLEEAGLEEFNNEPLHGQYLSSEGSIYSYTDWFYDGDESAFSVI